MQVGERAGGLRNRSTRLIGAKRAIRVTSTTSEECQLTAEGQTSRLLRVAVELELREFETERDDLKPLPRRDPQANQLITYFLAYGNQAVGASQHPLNRPVDAVHPGEKYPVSE